MWFERNSKNLCKKYLHVFIQFRHIWLSWSYHDLRLIIWEFKFLISLDHDTMVLYQVLDLLSDSVISLKMLVKSRILKVHFWILKQKIKNDIGKNLWTCKLRALQTWFVSNLFITFRYRYELNRCWEEIWNLGN